MTSATTIVVGSINRDLVIDVPAIPRPGETVLGTSSRAGLGGKGANQAVAAASAGASVRMIGAVGDDGADLVDALRSAGVDVAGVAAVSGSSSGSAVVTVAVDGENSIVVVPGANARLDETAVGARLSETADASAVVVLQAEIPVAAIARAARCAAELGSRLVLNLAPYVELGSDVVALADPLVVNEPEAAALLGWERCTTEDAAAAAVLLAGRAKTAIITLGADGAVAAQGDEVHRIPAVPIEHVVDTTGAGDAFVGALAAALADGSSLIDAARLAAAAGARAVGHRGAQPGRP